MRCLILSIGCIAASGCATLPPAPPTCSAEAVRAEVEQVLAAAARATIEQNIDAYLALVPETSVIHDTSGELVDRERLRANVLRDWAVIPETLSLEQPIESVVMRGCDEAEVIVGQRWERRMRRPNGAEGTDLVLTTQRHREIWRRTPQGWRGFDVEELGGEVFVNGERYDGN